MKDAQDCDKLGEAVKKRYTPRFPNGGTQYGKPVLPIMVDTRRIEISYVSEEKKSIEIPWVVTSETGTA